MTPRSPAIRVITHGGLLGGARTGSTDHTVMVGPGATLAEVLTSLGIDHGMVGVVVADGTIVQLDAVPQNDSVIDVYPIFGGG
jgi:sulfur carrier protein ThiS